MCQLLGTPPSWDTVGYKDNTAHPTLPTCPPGPPAPQHTGAPLCVVAASPLGRTIWGARSPACPVLLPVPKAPQSLPPGTRGLGSRKPPAGGDCSVPGGCPEPAWACEQSPCPSAGLPSQPPRICATSWHPPAPKGRKGGLSASFPSTATSSSLSFWHLPFSFPIPSRSPPRPHPHLQPPHDPRAHSERNPSDGKGGARAGRGARSPLPASPHLRAPAGKRAPHRTAPHHPAEGCAAPRSPAASPGGGPRGTHPSPGRQGRGAPGPGGSVPVRARRG